MKKLLFSISLISSTFFAFSQNVGINSTGALPNNSAGLDIDYTDKGLLLPRVNLTSTTDVVTIPAPATSLLVYNTNAAMTGGAVGFWYYDGAAWVQALGPQGLAGTNGANGINGTNGIDGLNCWDTNGDGIQDAGEDVNLDGFWNNLDCAGATGLTGTTGANGLDCWDADSDGIQDAGEDVNLDGFWNNLDCIGATGLAGTNGINGTVGPQGPQGIQGPIGPIGPSWTLSTPSFNANGTMVVNGTAGSGGPVTSVAGAWLTSGNNPVAVGDFMGSINASDVKFRTNNIERMTIEANGRIGLNGVTVPANMVHFSAGNSGGMWLTYWEHTGTTDAPAQFNSTNAANSNRVAMGVTNYNASGFAASAIIGLSLNNTTTGDGGIGVTGSANNESGNGIEATLFFAGGYSGWSLYTDADVFTPGGVWTASDLQFKKEIKPINGALGLISRLDPVSYYFDTDKYPGVGFDENRLTFGFIAQDLEKVIPEMVKDKTIEMNANTEKSASMSAKRETEIHKVVNYTLMVPILTQAIKEQQSIIEKLEKRIEALENK